MTPKTLIELREEISDAILDGMARTLAYEQATQIIDGSCCNVNHEVGADGWWEFDPESLDPAADDIRAALTYLEARGLIERHDTNPRWFAMLDESEASR